MRKKFLDNNIDGFSEVELLEFLLFYTNTRGDTNYTAHKLLNEFSSLNDILSADVFDLKNIDGVGEKSAIYLSFLGSLFSKLRLLSIKRPCLDTPFSLLSYCHSNVKLYESSEIIALILLDAGMNVIHFDLIAKGSLIAVGIDVKTIMRIISRHNAYSVVLLHNHLSGNVFPSRADIEATNRLSETLSPLGTELIDHVIVSGNLCYSIMRNLIYDSSTEKCTPR
ncbi:MAG: JAB domain-containing protein [Clostridia bacterium]